jgi:DNA (cytosine-5)-methyltransferase 1
VPALNEFVTVSDAAKYLGVSANTLRNWGREGKVPEHRHPINNYRLFKMSDLEQVRAKLAQPPLVRQT